MRVPYLTVLVAVAALGHPNFYTREKAEKKLVKMRQQYYGNGWNVWYVCQDIRYQSADPEVKERCRRIMKTP